MSTLPALASLREVAKFLRKRPTDVQSLLNTGKLPGAYREGIRWRIPKPAVLAWQASQRGPRGSH